MQYLFRDNCDFIYLILIIYRETNFYISCITTYIFRIHVAYVTKMCNTCWFILNIYKIYIT